jgi:hypothetical protein
MKKFELFYCSENLLGCCRKLISLKKWMDNIAVDNAQKEIKQERMQRLLV